MSTLQIQIRDELQERVSARATEAGFKSVEEYVESLVAADAVQDDYDHELEQLLLERLEGGPGIEMTPEFIAQFKEQIAQQLQSGRRV